MFAITLCIDVDGFQVQGQFVARELGWCTFDHAASGVLHYDHPYSWTDFTQKEQHAVSYIKRYNPTINFRAISLATLCHVLDSYHAITPVCVNICPPTISIEKKQS